ncbi:S8 family serine peptidase [Thalassotalea psychrophila]|uniref:S8 family serine peptidase n=1 Tax=Thalassotalea psychrophila TaxID=3065647 RepID=A0ABY9TYZ1_9GAMM|nr:S8 family serine peptidase [Colwelliaceae bacterium SQ149]
MKIKLRILCSVLPIALACQQLSAPAFAASNYVPADHEGESSILRSQENKSGYHLINNPFKEKYRSQESEYLVVLVDKPLATYAGNIQGLQATNMLASKHTNSTEKGKLNTKSLASKRYLNYLASKQQEQQLFINLRLQRTVVTDTSFNTAINGFSAKISASEAKIIAQLPEVIAVNKFQISHITTDRGPQFSGADKVWAGSPNVEGFKGEGVVVGIIDSGIASFLQPVEEITDLDNLPPFNPSFKDKVDEDGDGIIDYDHTNPYGEGVYFGDCAIKPGWCNDKLVGVVAFGIYSRDLVNSSLQDKRSATGQDTNGHGTHTASTAAGNVVRNVISETIIGSPLEAQFPQDFSYEQISGVAPHANIISYQVCNKFGSCTGKETLQAIEHAMNNNVDVLNYSVGMPATIPWYDHTSIAFLAAREAGIHVAVSAGNLGFGGRGTIKTPGNAPWLLSAAAVTHDRAFNDKTLTLTGGDDAFEMESNILVGAGATQGLAASNVVLAENVEYQNDLEHEHEHTHINEAGFTFADQHTNPTNSADYHNEMQDHRGKYTHTHKHQHFNAVERYGIAGSCGLGSLDPEQVAGRVVVCNRGGTFNNVGLSRVSKGFAVKAAGGAGMILINTNDSPDNIAADMHSVPAIHLEEKQGEILLDWLARGDNHQVTLSASEVISSTSFASEDDFSGVVGGFSSQGPDPFTKDYLVPSISAPGVDILASGLGYDMQEFDTPEAYRSRTEQVYQSGTSMASPHIAGMLALMKGLQPNWNPAQVQSALMLTAGTGLKFTGPVVKNKLSLVPAELHSTGAGLANVSRAAMSGLLMSESEQGYMAADPFGDVVFIQLPLLEGETAEPVESIRDLVKELPEGWHGEPARMNLPSLSKGDCLGSCTWTRTFTATKDATWNISYSYTTKGMELSSDKDGQQITLKADEKFSLSITASVTSELDSIWSDGRVHLSTTDESIPDVSLPVTVQFKAGKAPSEINIVAHRNEGSAPLKGVSSIGSDKFISTASALSKATIYDAKIKRSKYTEYYGDDKESIYVVPLSIPANSDRLIIEILETTSPDLDLFVGYDYNLDGEAGPFEIRGAQAFSIASNKALEVLDSANPVNGDFWLLVHNYGNQFNHIDDEDYDMATEQTYDDVKFAITVVSDDLEVQGEDELKVKAQRKNQANSAVPIDIFWQEDMQEDDRFYGIIGLGTKKELGTNIGTVNVNISRGIDDVALSLIDNDKGNTLATYEISFMANDSAMDKVYQLSVDLESGSILETITIANVINGAANTPQPLDVEQDGESISFTYNHPANSTASAVEIVFNYQNVSGTTDITPYVTSILDDSEQPQTARTKQAEMVKGRPLFTVAATNTLVIADDTVTLSAVVVDAVIDNAEISYQWQQISGPKVVTNINSSQLSFLVPKYNHDQELSFEFIGSNSARKSNPIVTTIYVTGEDNGNGGSLGFLWLALGFSMFALRRKTNINSK